MPEKTLRAFADHGELHGAMRKDGGDCDAMLAKYAKAGIDVDALAVQLQQEGTASFIKSWKELLQRIDDKIATVAAPASTRERQA